MNRFPVPAFPKTEFAGFVRRIEGHRLLENSGYKRYGLRGGSSMFYHKREFPEWTKWAGITLLLIAAFAAGYAGYSLYLDMQTPGTEESSVQLSDEPASLYHVRPEAEEPKTDEQAEKQEEPVPPPVPERIRSSQPWLHVVKGSYRMYYYRDDRLERTYRVAVGANGGQKRRVGDSRTPTGRFTVQQVQNSSKWTYDFGDGRGQTPGAYGPWFIRLKTPGWSGIGIHGTHDPDSIGRMVTQGCIRMKNSDLEDLKKKVFVGMKVVITEN